MNISIKDLSPGDEAEVIGYAAGDDLYKKKILSMGLTKGARLKVLKTAPLGDPVEVLVRGFRLSLRKNEAEALLLRRMES